MKKHLSFGLLLTTLFLTTSFALVNGDTLTAAERKFAIDYYRQTERRLLDDVSGLSAAQLHFKADSSRWSVAECVEHIALSESLIWQWIQGAAKQPAAPEKRSEVKMTTEQLIQALTDRSKKMSAPEFLKPENKFPDTQAALSAFMSRRDSTIRYLGTTNDDLKDHFITHPVYGTVDLYQGLVMLAAHSARHTLQIEEVKANPNFPKQ